MFFVNSQEIVFKAIVENDSEETILEQASEATITEMKQEFHHDQPIFPSDVLQAGNVKNLPRFPEKKIYPKK